jgi:ADP-ribosyltransferase exoenzyme
VSVDVLTRDRMLRMAGITLPDVDWRSPHEDAEERGHPHPGQKYKHGWLPVAGVPVELLTPDEAGRDYGDELDRVEFGDADAIVARSEGTLTIETDAGEHTQVHAAPSPGEAQEWADYIDDGLDLDEGETTTEHGLTVLRTDTGLSLRWPEGDEDSDPEDYDGVDLAEGDVAGFTQALRDMAYVTEDHQSVPDDEDEPDGGVEEPDAAMMRHRQLQLLGIEVRAFDTAKHPHYKAGVAGSKGGQFRPIGQQIMDALLGADGGDPDPLKGFSQPQLKKAAEQLGLNPPKGMRLVPLKGLLMAHGRGGKTNVPDAPAKAPAKKAATPRKAPAKRLASADLGAMSADEIAQAAADGRATPRMAAKVIREKASARANSVAFIGMGAPDADLSLERLAERRRGEAEVGRLRALADEIEGAKAPAAKKAAAKAKPAPKATPARTVGHVSATPHIEQVDAQQFERLRASAKKNQNALNAAPVRALFEDPKNTTKVTGLASPTPLPKAVQGAFTRYMGSPASINNMARLTPEQLARYVGPEDLDRKSRTATGYIRQLDKAMAASPLSDNVVVYRGVPAERTHIMTKWLDEAGVTGKRDFTGLTWTDGGFVSTSTSKGFTQETFASAAQPTKEPPILMRIVVPKGTGALHVSDAKVGLKESELLLDRGLTFRVVADHGVADRGYGARMLDVEVLQGSTEKATAEPLTSPPGRLALLEGKISDTVPAKPAAKRAPRAAKPGKPQNTLGDVVDILDAEPSTLDVMTKIAAKRAPKAAKPDPAKVQADFAEAVARPMPSDRDRFKKELGTLTAVQLADIAKANGVKLPAGKKQDKADFLVEHTIGAKLDLDVLTKGKPDRGPGPKIEAQAGPTTPPTGPPSLQPTAADGHDPGLLRRNEGSAATVGNLPDLQAAADQQLDLHSQKTGAPRRPAQPARGTDFPAQESDTYILSHYVTNKTNLAMRQGTPYYLGAPKDRFGHEYATTNGPRGFEQMAATHSRFFEGQVSGDIYEHNIETGQRRWIGRIRPEEVLPPLEEGVGAEHRKRDPDAGDTQWHDWQPNPKHWQDRPGTWVDDGTGPNPNAPSTADGSTAQAAATPESAKALRAAIESRDPTGINDFSMQIVGKPYEQILARLQASDLTDAEAVQLAKWMRLPGTGSLRTRDSAFKRIAAHMGSTRPPGSFHPSTVIDAITGLKDENAINERLAGFNMTVVMLRRFAREYNVTVPPGIKGRDAIQRFIAGTIVKDVGRWHWRDRPMSPEQRDRVLAMATRAAGQDITPGHDQLHHYWTRSPEGLARWVESETPWQTLVDNLVEEVKDKPLEVLKKWASRWFIEVFHFAAGSDLNRVTHGHPPRGKLVGPG